MTEAVTQMDPNQEQIDRLLRRSMATPVPTLPSHFDKRVLRAVRTHARSFERYRRFLFVGYLLASVIASAIVMRGQGLTWGPTAAMILAPLVLTAAARSVWRAAHRPALNTGQ